jgi:hypothetical protein
VTFLVLIFGFALAAVSFILGAVSSGPQKGRRP